MVSFSFHRLMTKKLIDPFFVSVWFHLICLGEKCDTISYFRLSLHIKKHTQDFHFSKSLNLKTIIGEKINENQGYCSNTPRCYFFFLQMKSCISLLIAVFFIEVQSISALQTHFNKSSEPLSPVYVHTVTPLPVSTDEWPPQTTTSPSQIITAESATSEAPTTEINFTSTDANKIKTWVEWRINAHFLLQCG